MAQAGLYRSAVLGVDLAIVEGSLRFYQGTAELYDTAHLIQRLSGMIESLEARSMDAEARAERASREAERALAGMRRSIMAVLMARGLGCSSRGRARLDACSDPGILELWLERAEREASEALVFGID